MHGIYLQCRFTQTISGRNSQFWFTLQGGGEDKRKKNTQSHCTAGEPVHSALPASVPCLRTEKAGNVFLNGVSRHRTPFTVNKRARLSVRSNVRQSFSKRAKEKPIF